MTIELHEKMYPTILCTVKCPMIRPQRYNALQMPTSGYQPQVGSDRVALIYTFPYVVQISSPTHPGQFYQDLRSTTFTDREQRLFSSRVTTNASSSKPSALSVTAPIAHATCRNPDQTWNVYFSITVPRETEASTTDMLCSHSLHDVSSAVATSRGANSALAENATTALWTNALRAYEGKSLDLIPPGPRMRESVQFN